MVFLKICRKFGVRESAFFIVKSETSQDMRIYIVVQISPINQKSNRCSNVSSVQSKTIKIIKISKNVRVPTPNLIFGLLPSYSSKENIFIEGKMKIKAFQKRFSTTSEYMEENLNHNSQGNLNMRNMSIYSKVGFDVSEATVPKSERTKEGNNNYYIINNQGGNLTLGGGIIEDSSIHLSRDISQHMSADILKQPEQPKNGINYSSDLSKKEKKKFTKVIKTRRNNLWTKVTSILISFLRSFLKSLLQLFLI